MIDMLRFKPTVYITITITTTVLSPLKNQEGLVTLSRGWEPLLYIHITV